MPVQTTGRIVSLAVLLAAAFSTNVAIAENCYADCVEVLATDEGTYFLRKDHAGGVVDLGRVGPSMPTLMLEVINQRLLEVDAATFLSLSIVDPSESDAGIDSTRGRQPSAQSSSGAAGASAASGCPCTVEVISQTIVEIEDEIVITRVFVLKDVDGNVVDTQSAEIGLKKPQSEFLGPR